MHKEHDFWYAVNLTQVALQPKKALETFGASVIKYHLISEFPDAVDRIRIRTGKVHSERPQIITPGHFAQQILDGFGDEAKEYAEWLQQHNELIQILKYGIQFRKEQVSTEETHAPLAEVIERVKTTVEKENDTMSAVLVGADDLWEVSLLKFLRDFIERSAPVNVRDIRVKQHETSLELQREIEMDFRMAQHDRNKVPALGDKLQRLGLFEKYEDRFYSLLHG
jgi:hypothetical protein